MENMSPSIASTVSGGFQARLGGPGRGQRGRRGVDRRLFLTPDSWNFRRRTCMALFLVDAASGTKRGNEEDDSMVLDCGQALCRQC